MYKIYISNSLNPYFNLAFEEYLVQHHNPNEQILFLWQNQNTIVIGRNQNPWRECKLEEMNRINAHLVRRLSGGGAVYHDVGNLNFTFITDFSEERVQQNIQLIIDALALNGVSSVFSGKNDILAEGNKISGNAFFVDGNTLCHHGTLLVDVDIDVLDWLLTVDPGKLHSKGIDSVRSRVVNIKELNGEITVASLKQDLIHTFCSAGKNFSLFKLDENKCTDELVNLNDISMLMARYESWDWNFGQSPEFNFQFSRRYPFGGVDIFLLVIDGLIKEAKVFTDALDITLSDKIELKILGMKFAQEELEELLLHLS